MLNFIIRFCSYFAKPIEGNPNEWLERGYSIFLGEPWREFICGSCRGIYKTENKEYQILAVQNTKKNNDFDKVLERFIKSARRDGYAVSFLEVGNPKLEKKLRALGFIGTKQKLTLTT